jgi:type I restriction-modification system DNA methylase subunit
MAIPLVKEQNMSNQRVPDLYKEFEKTMEPITRRHDCGKVFSDFLTASICSFHTTNIKTRLQVKDEANEALYMETIARYTKDEINTFPKLMGIFMQAAYQDPYSDILGRYFTENITMGQNGQFFTPSSVCNMMAQMQGEPKTITGKRIADPAAGSGRLLLSFAKYQPDNYFYASDNTNTCAKMSTLNFFINGLRGEVAWMNALSMEWYGGWHINTQGPGILPIDKEQSVMWSNPPKPPEPPKTKPFPSSGQSDQLTLF